MTDFDELEREEQAQLDEQQALVERCSGAFPPVSYDEDGVHFCGGCGAQYDDPDHGVKLA